ncbi:uncharacterized protein Z518_07065 [Rhinocladiella mackenziei CBS 650.93]|uniref:RNase III domain-containing protein n=1 Tax=Rhinocladiella mackenziei CBS 650.93 TaxID=1442369 RepID=A0A0D2FNB4_9EURO|nr:uncharacterized protein Z518_07065 [Rhinocladiella mackenziei CBS 650.93]KIX03512.1 hypothetical protein Z518_07065 [Rhinocladiella mackenziei CBS 650.93]
MSSVDRKRKPTGGHSPPHKKFQKGSPNHGPDKFPPLTSSSDNGLLPPLPSIDEKFRDVVFTHQSMAGSPAESYDRLEFLGDAYLQLFSSRLIWDRLPFLPAGRMSQVRESLVKNETLAQYSDLYGLTKQLKNFKRFQNGPPQTWLKIKGDLFEAYVAAVVLSTPEGFERVRNWLLHLWEPKIEAITSKPEASSKSKEELAKKVLGKGVRLNYEDEREPIIHYGQGRETYFVGVYLTGWGWENQYLGSGKGLSRNAAGQEAAAAALENHPLIDEIIAKKTAFYAEAKKKGEPQPNKHSKD